MLKLLSLCYSKYINFDEKGQNLQVKFVYNTGGKTKNEKT
ncbi:hypothetical protein CBY_3862 [Clostridium butyricum 5521]|uniref:Uncharacterized protein n=1 Tax=Clostridium butyricum E4 str. BoNT E BL5262 TaxID=632245 RepID=C4IJR0_CLOBU|nr:hypothetical protein CBY_3862 [Clostridium butyricum 5521]EEP54486.1 hypothetical protein CLP_1030 [Clostridium butyricum E4 str. BoNT E BL5262]EMU53762.1 hypothetical protein CBDKU1_22780 [Clostridium butyricum DKU-01]